MNQPLSEYILISKVDIDIDFIVFFTSRSYKIGVFLQLGKSNALNGRSDSTSMICTNFKKNLIFVLSFFQ
jgi:hypothetical protein